MPKHDAAGKARPPADAVPEMVWTPLATAVLVLLPGIVGMAAGRPMLFPSLGPTALHQAHTPDHPSSKVYNVVVSHLLGMGAGFLMVILFGIAKEKSVFELGHLTWPRVAASVAAVAIAAVLELVLHASHPPAASTTLLVALGTFKPTVRDAVTLVAGVLIVAAAGELLRRMRARGEKAPGARNGVEA
jgi:hypothetical protein